MIFSKKLLEAESAKLAIKSEVKESDESYETLEAMTKAELLELADEKGIEGLSLTEIRKMTLSKPLAG
ncbi:hypothetical protein KHA80_14365 [Anaerobacillus sp. HL2]|nr:hypothetical protein KHA80_14365 [Anaerobacillus sp. HL2]